jgi:hypothetical protein
MKQPLNLFPREVKNSGMWAVSNRHDVAELPRSMLN